MAEWLKVNKPGSQRVFGYNIDANGNRTYDPGHEGYRVLVITNDTNTQYPDIKTEAIAPGRFLVIRAEGTLDSVQEWLPAGWMKMNDTIREKNLKVKEQPRWYEEHLRSGVPDFMAVDLYLELS
jgi:hypothetical protein